MAKKRAHGQITSAHSTKIPAAEPVLEFARRKDSGVKRVVLGRIGAGLPFVPRRLKLVLAQGALFVRVRGGNEVQELRLYTNDPEYVERKIREVLSDQYIITGPKTVV